MHLRVSGGDHGDFGPHHLPPHRLATFRLRTQDVRNRIWTETGDFRRTSPDKVAVFLMRIMQPDALLKVADLVRMIEL
jgi:hypothetical protein